MLIQLLECTAILGAIALTPKLVTIELTHAGADLWQAIKDRAPEVLVKGKALYRAATDKLAGLPQPSIKLDQPTPPSDQAETREQCIARLDRLDAVRRDDAELNRQIKPLDGVHLTPTGYLRQLGETQAQRIKRLDRVDALRSNAGAPIPMRTDTQISERNAALYAQDDRAAEDASSEFDARMCG